MTMSPERKKKVVDAEEGDDTEEGVDASMFKTANRLGWGVTGEDNKFRLGQAGVSALEALAKSKDMTLEDLGETNSDGEFTPDKDGIDLLKQWGANEQVVTMLEKAYLGEQSQDVEDEPTDIS